MRPSLQSPSGARQRFRPSISLVFLGILLGALWLAGGASRADVTGQIVVRSTAWALLVAVILFGQRPALGPVRAVLALLIACLLLALVQLVPLPPGWWQGLPGRTVFAEAAAASGQPQPWRPWSIVPGATVNAAQSLVVPFATLIFAAGLGEDDRRWLPGILLGVTAASMVVGLLQFSGGASDNPFVNDTVGQVSGTLANRNHFALLLALGCVLAPAWAFLDGRRPAWRAPVAFSLVLLFALAILASGSRAGLLLGMLAIMAGLLLVQRPLRHELGHYPRWVSLALVAAIVTLVAIVVLASVAADRAVSINRLIEADQGQDMRTRGLPTVLAMIRAYLPWGSGLGGFDPLFRLHEPFELLKLTYFNHAHNDFLEVVLDAGVPGLLLLATGVSWWAWASVGAWRGARRDMLARVGSAMLALILLASSVDYPARTPIIMAMTVLAAIWLARGARTSVREGSALPSKSQHL